MEEAGETSDPQHAPQEPAADGRASGPAGGPLIVIGIIVIVALVGLVAWMAGGDDVVQTVERADQRFPEETTTVAPTVPGGEVPEASSSPDSTAPAAPVTPPPTPPPTPVPTPPPTQPPGTPAPTAPPTTPVTTVPRSTTPPGPAITALVPSVAAFAEPLLTPEATRAQIDQLLTAPRHDVASDRGVAALCAIVPLDGPIVVGGRWERDGRQVSSSVAAGRDAPGFGECVGNDGELLDDGSYQYIATDADGRESAAAGFVAGAARIAQQFTNNGDDPICGVRIAPATSRYFEAYVFDVEPVAPGASITLPVADVRQDVETMSCRKGEVLAAFDLRPDPDEVQDLRP